MPEYIYEQPDWPQFRFDDKTLSATLGRVRHRQGQLTGKMQSLGFPLKEEALLDTLTLDVRKSSEIEGELIDQAQIRSSIARRLGIESSGLVPSTRNVDGIVEMMLDATQNFAKPLTGERLFGWHSALFPTGRSGIRAITVGAWRRDEDGPMQVISGALGKENVHYQAPSAHSLPGAMSQFLAWVNACPESDPVLKAAIAHLWFLTLHPFDDGNGRIARAIADMLLARSDESSLRFYSLSAQILKERDAYYSILEKTQKGTLDITAWLDWFLHCMERALTSAEDGMRLVFAKAEFWKKHRETPFNERQRLMLNRLLDGAFFGKLKSSKWAKIVKCSTDTALRDIKDLLDKKVLRQEASEGGRSTNYVLNNE